MSTIEFKLVRAEATPLQPNPRHAGVTLHACFGLDDFAPTRYKRPPIAGAPRTLYLNPGETFNVPTGIEVVLDEQYFGLIVARPTTPYDGLVVQPMLVDPGHRAELYVRVRFMAPYDAHRSVYYLNSGDAIARLVLLPISTAKLVQS